MLRLKELRKNKGWTQAEFAKRLGVAQSSYSEWENEKKEMDYYTLKRMAIIFNTSVDYILGRPMNKLPEGKDKNQ